MKEIKEGSASIISIVCEDCGTQNKVVTCEQHRYGKSGPKANDVNTRIALGAIDNGIGFTHMNNFLTTLNVPTLNKSAYKKRGREVGRAIEEVASNSCEMVLQDEICAAEKNGKIPDTDGLMSLSVSYDMQWLKRGRGNNSLTGHGAVIGMETKKILDYGCANTFCRVCKAAKSKGKQPASHDCRMNHSGSSKAMEAAVGVKLFNQGPKHGVKYSVFIGDDDSATIAKICEEVQYNVDKWSDTSYATRTVVGIYKRSALKEKNSQENHLFPRRSLTTFASVLATVLVKTREKQKG